MEYSIETGELAGYKTPCLVLGIFDKHRLMGPARVVDEASGGRLSAILKKGDLEGETGQSLLLYDLPGVAAERVLLVGCGKHKEYNRTQYRKALTAAMDQLQRMHASEALSTLHQEPPQDLSPYLALRDTITAAADRTYRYQRTKKDKKAPKLSLRHLRLWVSEARDLKAAELARLHGTALAAGTHLARELGNLPGNLCTPGYLADQARELARRFPKLRVEILEEAQMTELGMGALLGVARGSRQPPKLIVCHFQGAGASDQPVVLVGKGITFDAGGISLKPGPDMDEMKFDMSGGASVLGTVQAICALDLPLNLVGVVPAAENLPDGAANKPGDVVTSLSGQTIEILNTDAEGRLILCDALTYCERFNPALVIDIATLTGACIIALGKHVSGLFSHDETLVRDLETAGLNAWDRVWRLPLWEEYQSQLDSNFADMANIGGRDGGSITAACFLSRFTRNFRWAHLDIAGTAALSGKEKGSTGRPVPLLVQFLLERSGALLQ